ncbi:MAG: hypothetical protein ACKO7W_00375 [Elainella sp.]
MQTQTQLFKTEAELVTAYRAYLNQERGITTQTEVSCGKGFAADLVSAQTVWEAKLILDREHLYQALGQVMSYRRHLNKPKAAIFGLSPTEPQSNRQAQRIAAWLRPNHPRLWVLFVDTDLRFIHFIRGKTA